MVSSFVSLLLIDMMVTPRRRARRFKIAIFLRGARLQNLWIFWGRGLFTHFRRGLNNPKCWAAVRLVVLPVKLLCLLLLC